MKVNAVIFAGGSGKRMKINSIPKQFMELNGKPIIVYTLEFFQKHQQIDSIVVVCVDGWIDHLKQEVDKYHLDKVKWIVKGGKSGQESIFNGLRVLNDYYGDDDSIVLIHDGVRPLINEQVITGNINCVMKNKTAITVTEAIETIMKIDKNSHEVEHTVDRHSCMMARAPQSFYLKDIYNAHLKMIKDKKFNMIDSATIMEECGYKLFTVIGPPENIKITTPTDFYMFTAVMNNLKEE